MPDQETHAEEAPVKPIIDDRSVIEESIEDWAQEEADETGGDDDMVGEPDEVPSMTAEERKADFLRSLVRFKFGEWREELHPRKKGKFAPKGQGDSGAGPEEPKGEAPAPKAEPAGEKKAEAPAGGEKREKLISSKMPGVIFHPQDFDNRLRPGAPKKPVPEREWIEHLEGLPRETIMEYRLPDGTWKPERQKLHKQIIDKFFEGKKPAPPDQAPHVTFMLGGPASGKSSLADKIKAGGDHVVIDPDGIKGELPEYQKATAASAKDAAFMAHEESSEVSKLVRNQAMVGRYNILVDGTGANYDSYAGVMQKMKAQGYVVDLIAVDLDAETALKRAKSRAQKTGRYVPENVISHVYEHAYPNFEKFVAAGLVDRWALYDNRGDIPRRVWSGGEGMQEEVLDDKFVAEFRARRPKPKPEAKS